jgi:hypothetical protein
VSSFRKVQPKNYFLLAVVAMRRIQNAIFAEESILQQYSCHCDKSPHLYLVKKENDNELLNDLKENSSLEVPPLVAETEISGVDSNSRVKNTVIHYDHRYYDRDEASKFCDVLVHPSGWKFYSFHRHILQEHEIRQLLSRMKKALLHSFPSIQEEVKNAEGSGAEGKEKEFMDSDHLDFNGFKLHLPPVLFGVDVMFLEYHPPVASSRFALSIDPSDSIYSWVSKVVSCCRVRFII